MGNSLNLTLYNLRTDTAQLILTLGTNMVEEIISKKAECLEFILWLIQVK
jgi:hypothetical protein